MIRPPEWALATSAMVAAALVAGGCGGAGGAAVTPAIGARVPALTLPDLEGAGSLSLAGYPGRAVVVNLWAAWCGPCRAEEPGLVAAAVARRAAGVAFLGIDWRDDPAQARSFRQEFGVPYPSMRDDSGVALQSLGVAYIPATLVISADGRLLARHLGGLSPAALAALLRSLPG